MELVELCRILLLLMLIGCGREAVTLTISKGGYHVHQHSVDLDEFNAPSEGGIAEKLASEAEEFFNRYNEKFHAFRKLYEANLSYRNLVNPSAREPELDYSYIFRSL